MNESMTNRKKKIKKEIMKESLIKIKNENWRNKERKYEKKNEIIVKKTRKKV